MEMILSISGLSKSFGRSILNRSGDQEFESNKVIDNLDVEIHKGEIACVVGGNGAGKSTLLNLIQNYTSSDSGSIDFLFNHKKIDLSTVLPFRMNKIGIGRLFQNKLVFKELSVMDNMILGASESKNSNPFFSVFNRKSVVKDEQNKMNKAISIWSELFGSDNFLIKSIHKPAGTLSYGQQRILAISRLLMGDYGLVILDEPTSGVDVEMIEVIRKLIMRFKSSQITVLIVEHNMDFVFDVADRVLWMDGGKIRMDGTGKILLENQEFQNTFLSYD